MWGGHICLLIEFVDTLKHKLQVQTKPITEFCASNLRQLKKLNCLLCYEYALTLSICILSSSIHLFYKD